MKTLVALLGLITASFLPGEAVVAVRIRAYNASGYIPLEQVLLGTRLILICDVEGLAEGSLVNSYKWYHSCKTGRCEIQRESPYYKAVNDTLLVDATFWGGGRRRHICEIEYRSEEGETSNLQKFKALSLTDKTTPFFYTPISLLLKHSLITDVQQIIGSNEQQWINCTRGGSWMDGRQVQIISVKNSALISRNSMTATIGPERNLHNGLYYCSDGQAPRHYISLFLKNSSNLPPPTVHVLSTTAWGFTSPDGSQVERYIVEFQCRVRNITFVEKYMSVSASGGTGQVATSVSCFGGQGQLYRVKVWAVRGPNISRKPAEKMADTVDGNTLTTKVLTSTPTSADGTRTPGDVPTSTRSNKASCQLYDRHTLSSCTVNGPTLTTQVLTSTPTSAGGTRTPDGPTPTTQVLTSTPTTGGSTMIPITIPTPIRSDASSSTPSGTPSATPEHVDSQPQGGPFIGVGVGVGLCLLVVLALVAIILVVVVVKGRAAKQTITGGIKMRAIPCYNNPVVVELEEKDVAAEYDDTVKNKENGSISDGFDPYEDVDSKAQNRNAKSTPPKASFTPVSATNVGELYAVVDISKKKGAKKKEGENGCIETNRDDLYTVPVKKKDKMTEKRMGASDGAEKSEDDDVVELKYEPKADSQPAQQQSEGDEKSLNADMLYAVVDKSRKKKK